MSTPKKRGRKSTASIPKKTTSNEPKKRGRKPKQKSYSVQGVPVETLVNNNEHIILHLPFRSKDVYQDNLFSTNQDKLMEYDPTISEPQPISSDYAGNFSVLTEDKNLAQNFYSLDSDESKMKKESVENDKDILSFIKEDKTETEIKKVNKTSELKIKEDDLDTYLDTDVYVHQSMNPYSNEKQIMRKNLNNIQYEFLDSNIKGEWPESTNIYCMWCCHPFEGPPCAIPSKCVDGKFYVSGCFCSFNCATSHIFNDSKSGDMWEKYSLLNLLYKKIYDKDFIKIKPAPPREVLTIFGGFLNIDDYRKNMIQNNRDYKIIKPPLVSMVPKVEESIIEYSSSNPVPVDKEKMDNAAKKLRLKRQKPLMNNTHTLESFMDMTYLS